MSQYHFILDYETIGQDVFTAPVINCAYYVFDWTRFTSDNPYTFNELVTGEIKQDKFKLERQVKEDGYRYNKDDLQFWLDQGDEARKQIMPSDKDIDVDIFVQRVYSYLQGKKIFRWWSRSNTFDPILLHRNFMDSKARHQLDQVLPYWLVRDIRTYIDTRFDFKLRKNGFCPIDDQQLWDKHFIAHNSVHDVAADILRLQKLERVCHLDED